jgi:hypothetical protein
MQCVSYEGRQCPIAAIDVRDLALNFQRATFERTLDSI